MSELSAHDPEPATGLVFLSEILAAETAEMGSGIPSVNASSNPGTGRE
jgi:hypothetical protein